MSDLILLEMEFTICYLRKGSPNLSLHKINMTFDLLLLFCAEIELGERGVVYWWMG